MTTKLSGSNNTSFFQRRVTQPLLNLLRQGMTPHKLALTCAVGAVIGVIPALGTTTVLVTIIAARLRLNIAATILISYVVHPLQFLLLIPYARAGIALFGLEELRFSFDEIMYMFKNDWLDALQKLWQANLVAVVAWLLLAAPAGAVIYFVLLPVLKRFIPANNVLEA